MRTRTTVAAVLLLGATACSSNDAKPAPTVTVTKTAASSPGSAAPSASSATYAFGQPWEFESSEGNASTFDGTVTVLGYKQGVTSVGSASEEAGQSGYVWAYADLKLCVTQGSYSDDNTSWTLYYSDGSRIDPSSSTYDDFPKPEFPVQVTVTEGKCARGKLVFPVPEGKRPASVLYSPPGLATPTEWTVPKA
ncbi:hypothetical protein [Streptomyces sp. NPDC001604]|uniref:hypothetical protein n=1 Tax=Streptomyces sp. NPDC001604 TaxID=3364593 RepID=UPI0036785DE7